MTEPLTITVNVGDLIAGAFWFSIPAIAWWRWYTDPHRPVRKKK